MQSSSNVKFTIKTRSRSRQGNLDTFTDLPPNLEPQQEDCESRGEDFEDLLEDSRELGQVVRLSTSSQGSESSVELPEYPKDSSDDMAEARGPLITPGKFRGGPGESIEDYLTQFERVARANGWEENKRLVVIPCYLEGAALKWYENAEDRLGAALTWNQVKEGLKETFQAVAYDEQLEYRLRMRMQVEDETVESYIQDVLYLCSKVDPRMTERSKIKHVLRGLRPSLLERVMVLENDTLEALTANIKRVQTARFMAGQRVDHLMKDTPKEGSASTAVGGPERDTVRGSTLEEKIENLTSEFAKFSMRLMEQQSDRGGRPGSTSQGIGRGFNSERGRVERGRGNYRGHNRGRTSDGRVICFRCNRPGHFAVACRSSSQGNADEGR